ncbi:hypothetical protein PIB30_103027, partial [Stylosanthes scabra]|nr:hypothetical protein [Stylosanthes scabra]
YALKHISSIPQAQKEGTALIPKIHSGRLKLAERLDIVGSEGMLRQPFKLEPVPQKSDIYIRNENPQPMDS